MTFIHKRSVPVLAQGEACDAARLAQTAADDEVVVLHILDFHPVFRAPARTVQAVPAFGDDALQPLRRGLFKQAHARAVHAGTGRAAPFPAHGFKTGRLAFHKRYGEQLPGRPGTICRTRQKLAGCFSAASPILKALESRLRRWTSAKFGRPPTATISSPSRMHLPRVCAAMPASSGNRGSRRSLRLLRSSQFPLLQIGEAALAVQLQLKNEIPLSNAPALKPMSMGATDFFFKGVHQPVLRALSASFTLCWSADIRSMILPGFSSAGATISRPRSCPE